MNTRVRIAVLSMLSVAACGRSELDTPSFTVPDGSPSTVIDGGPGAGVKVGNCPDALLAGSPAPTSAYCSTRAYESAYSAPTQTDLLWTVALPGTTSPDDTVIVTPSGRAFVRVDMNKDDSGWIATRLVAVDPGGKIAFERDMDGAINGVPWLDEDGALAMLVVKLPMRTVLAIDQQGKTLRSTTFDEPLRGEPAIGPDGTTYFLLDDWKAPVRVLALSKSGERLWTSGDLGQSPRHIAMDRAGHALLATRKGEYSDFGSEVVVTAIDRDGTNAWETSITTEGHLMSGPTVGPDGASYTVLWTDKSTKTTLVVLEPSGKLRHAIDVQAKPWGGGTPLLSVGGDGAAYVKAGESLTAIDQQGNIRWSRYAHPNVLMGCTIDAAGAVIVSSGKVEVLDALTGVVTSTYAGPPKQQPGNTIYAIGGATLVKGAYYFTDFGKQLYAVGAP